MALKDWFSRQSPLQLALQRGTRPGADLADELRKLKEYTVTSKADAESVCDALERVNTKGMIARGDSSFHALVGLFQDVERHDSPAFSVMSSRGISILVQIVDGMLQMPSPHKPDDVLFALKILAMYGTRTGTDAVLGAARRPLQSDSWMWHVIFQAYGDGHPERERLFKELCDPLPIGFVAVALLDSANAAHLKGSGDSHPFDSPAGIWRIEQWLTDKDEEHFSYAISATAALPFITCPGRDALLALAFGHPSVDVQIEAAWVAAKLGRASGIRWLARSCLDVNLSEKAKRYLGELGHADAIPTDSEETNFKAKAEFAQWLAHPNELGRAPDELEVLDDRELPWPPERAPKRLWLLKYRVKDATGLKNDDVGVGLVGSVTFCLFSYNLEQRPPQDAYAIHCYWEMMNRRLIAEADVPENSNEYDHMIGQYAPECLVESRIILVAEMSPELNYPQQLVALAKATRHGETGWIVLDGPRSQWYGTSEMPDEQFDKTVAMIHVGSVMLGFLEQPDRHKLLRATESKRSPQQIIAAYERLLDEARSDSTRKKKLIGNHSVLGSAFMDYVSALCSTQSRSKAVCISAAYEAILSVGEQTAPSIQSDVFDSFSPLGEHFEGYVDALIELHRLDEVPALIEKFRPYWDHNLGYGKLGSAAFKSGHDQLAESFMVKLRDSMKDWFRNETMNSLAEIWRRQGRIEEAHSLLIDALNGLVEQSRAATGSDRQLFEDWFQNRRAAYLRNFPERADVEFRRNGIPPSTLNAPH